LIGGRIVELPMTGSRPNEVAANIFVNLRSYAKSARRGKTYTDNIGFSIPELHSGRESFSPDVAYYVGPLPANEMRFIEGTPTFAVEVRSEGDCAPHAELEMAAKRDDYFQAGTLVVWDVDPEAETVAVYRRDDPTTPTVFRRGDVADADPATPGWRMSVDEVFEK
jgi:Uma2 family endonuclease